MVSDPNLVPRSPKVIRKGDLAKFDFEHAQWQPARKTGLSITAHVRTFHCYFESILEEVILGREQGNLKLKPKQKVALQAISLIGQDCLIVLPTGYEKSLTYQMLPSL